jgi:hypothetical protein
MKDFVLKNEMCVEAGIVFFELACGFVEEKLCAPL